MSGRHAARPGQARSIALAAASRAAVLTWRAAAWAARAIAVPAAKALWAWSRPRLRRGAVMAGDALLAHCTVRKIIGDLMLVSWPAAYYAASRRWLPDHKGLLAGMAGVSVCKLLLLVIDRQQQRGWRQKRGEVIGGGRAAALAGMTSRLDAHDEKFAALFGAMDDACRAAGLPAGLAAPHLQLVTDDSRDSA